MALFEIGGESARTHFGAALRQFPRRLLRRLRKDRPDIHARVLAGELSPHGGMVAAGFRKKPVRNKAAALPPEVSDEEARGPPGLEATFRARKRYAEIVTRNDAGNANRPLDL